jgi:hypothetical protein
MSLKLKQTGAGLYEIIGTDLLISKDPPPRFREPQQWSIVPRSDQYLPLLTGKGRAQTMEALETLLRAIPAELAEKVRAQ